MSKGEFASFKDIVADVLSNRKKDPLLHLLVLTYEFDDQQLRNLACGQQLDEDFEIRQKDLKILSDLRPIVIYDARKTNETNSLPQFLELHPYKSDAYACHHSKAYFLVTRKTVRLVLGSFNLTLTGLFKNREVFQDFTWESEASSDRHILAQWLVFLEDHYASRLQASSLSSLRAMLDTVKARLAAWKPAQGQSDSRLFHSGYGMESGLAQLQRQWESWFPGTQPESLFAISPFFDENPKLSSLAGELAARFPALRSRTLITDEAVAKKLGKPHFGTDWKIAECRLITIPSQLGPQELERIQKAANLNKKAAKDLIIQRKLHAKILILRAGAQALAYMGSANFSRKAWDGKNLELGLVWKEVDPDGLEKAIVQSLGAKPENHFAALPESAPPLEPEADEEGYKEDSDFPGFLESILLEPAQDQTQVRFRFESGQRPEAAQGKLDAYRIEWGSTLLQTDGEGFSQWLDCREFKQRIAGYRNIAFKPKRNPSRTYYFPFQYTGTLIADRESYILPTSLDWMAFYLDPDQGNRGMGLELLPGEDSKTNIRYQVFLEVDRSGNCVIAMQTYLNLFGDIEADFQSRLKNLGEFEAVQVRDSFLHDFVEPLRSLGRILEQEAGAPKQIPAAEHLFKMGEFLSLLNQLREGAPAEVRTLLDPVRAHARKALSRWAGTESMRRRYAEFATTEGSNG